MMEEDKEDLGGVKAKIKGWKKKKREAEVKSVIGVRQAKAISVRRESHVGCKEKK